MLCPNGFDYGPIDGQRELGYKCDSGTIFVEHGTEIGAGQKIGEASGSSIILSLHPWVAKGKKYLSLSRGAKEVILWNKIIADTTTNPNPSTMLESFDIDVAGVFDEFGDELGCRNKTLHQLGNIAKAEWINLGGHDYTGVFKGADTCFVRLNTQHPVVTPDAI